MAHKMWVPSLPTSVYLWAYHTKPQVCITHNPMDLPRFSEHGIPEVLCSDNGPQYASAQFDNFCISWGISHKTSSLHYPQSNGFAKVFRAWHPWSPLLWQWPTICECPVWQLLYILGHITRNLKYALPTIQWICQGMHQVYQTCTPKSQIQWCWPTAHPASTLSYTHWHQASISSRAVVPMLTQNNHSGQDMQQWPISHTSPWADWCML